MTKLMYTVSGEYVDGVTNIAKLTLSLENKEITENEFVVAAISVFRTIGVMGDPKSEVEPNPKKEIVMPEEPFPELEMRNEEYSSRKGLIANYAKKMFGGKYDI